MEGGTERGKKTPPNKQQSKRIVSILHPSAEGSSQDWEANNSATKVVDTGQKPANRKTATMERTAQISAWVAVSDGVNMHGGADCFGSQRSA